MLSPAFTNHHIPGDQMMVDFAGDRLSYTDKDTGEKIACPVLVCVLPYSSYTYAVALPNARLPHLVAALNKCLRFFRGVPRWFKTDNMKQVVVKSNRYEPTFTELMEQWALHYNIALAAARPFRPQDKAAVENHVKIVYNRIYAPLRDQQYFSLEALNEAIAIQLDIHNKKCLQGKTYSRRDRFEKEELPALDPLPANDFQLQHSVQAKVQKNYHITIGEDWHHYSVPFKYIGKQVKAIYDTATVEIYLGHQRIAIHKRSVKRHGYTTLEEHMPEQHKKYTEQLGWDNDFFLKQAEHVGPSTKTYIEKLLQSRRFTEQTFQACRGLLRLRMQYGNQRLEAVKQLGQTPERLVLCT